MAANEVKQKISIDLNVTKIMSSITSLQNALKKTDGTIADIRKNMKAFETERINKFANTIRILQSSLNKGTNLKFSKTDINVLSQTYEKYLEQQEAIKNVKEEYASIVALIKSLEESGKNTKPNEKRLSLLNEEAARLKEILDAEEKRKQVEQEIEDARKKAQDEAKKITEELVELQKMLPSYSQEEIIHLYEQNEIYKGYEEKLKRIKDLCEQISKLKLVNADPETIEKLQDEVKKLREETGTSLQLEKGTSLKDRLLKSLGNDNYKGVFKNIDTLFGVSDKKKTTAKNLELVKADKASSAKDIAAAEGAAKGASKASIALAVMQAIWEIAKKIANEFNKMLKSTIGISLSIKDIFSDIATNISEILSMTDGMMTYNTTQSLISNQQAREQQMRYGISASQNWALSQVKDVLGMKSEEDMWYMNRNQKAMFDSLMLKYQDWYEDLNRNGTLAEVQQFQVEFQLFKQKMAMEFLTWFAKNKDVIFTAIKNIAEFIMRIVDLVTNLVTFFGANKQIESEAYGSAIMSDALKYASSSSKTVNINVNQTNNLSGTISDQNELVEQINEYMEKTYKETDQTLLSI